ncbi:Nodulin-26 [Capsicum annuum]|nr:Nodulin-26 [Capsicum annuum]
MEEILAVDGIQCCKRRSPRRQWRMARRGLVASSRRGAATIKRRRLCEKGDMARRGEAIWRQWRCLLIGDWRCYHLSHKFDSGDRQRTPATPATPLIGDFVGTYMLIFAGCAAIILNINKVNVVTLPGIASVWGLLVMVLIYSGAHFNPAVTIAFATSPGECLTSPACTGECNIIEPAKALISETNPPKYKSFS